MADLPRPDVHRGPRPTRPRRRVVLGASRRVAADDRPYDRSRTFFRAEEDFPGPRTMPRRGGLAARGAPDDAPFLLFVDEFDPHEPFDTPEPWLGRYDPDWEGEILIWPPYDVGAVAAGRLSEREGRHIRANYGAKLSMIDHWVGEVFAALSDRGLWDSTVVIVCTDHGHYLGEKDIWGKPGVMQYEPLGHIPLLVHWPGVAGGPRARRSPPTSTSTPPSPTCSAWCRAGTAHGVSLGPLVEGSAAQVREWAIGGVYGNWVQVTDGRRKYARGAAGENFPLTCGRTGGRPCPSTASRTRSGCRRPTGGPGSASCPGRTYPSSCSLSSPVTASRSGWATTPSTRTSSSTCHEDPDENENLTGTAAEADMVELLRVALRAVAAPNEQFERLGVG